MKYSASTRGFYLSDVQSASIPSDAQEITNDEYRALLASNKAGLTIEPGDNGKPVAKGAAPQTLDDLKAQLTAAATAKRWEVETGGITLTGLRVATAKADQDRITSVLVNAPPAGIDRVRFKAESGWITLTIAQLRDVASAITLHVQACFDAESDHHEAIQGLQTLEAAQAYDVNAGWPAQ